MTKNEELDGLVAAFIHMQDELNKFSQMDLSWHAMACLRDQVQWYMDKIKECIDEAQMGSVIRQDNPALSKLMGNVYPTPPPETEDGGIQ